MSSRPTQFNLGQSPGVCYNSCPQTYISNSVTGTLCASSLVALISNSFYGGKWFVALITKGPGNEPIVDAPLLGSQVLQTNIKKVGVMAQAVSSNACPQITSATTQQQVNVNGDEDMDIQQGITISQNLCGIQFCCSSCASNKLAKKIPFKLPPFLPFYVFPRCAIYAGPLNLRNLDVAVYKDFFNNGGLSRDGSRALLNLARGLNIDNQFVDQGFGQYVLYIPMSTKANIGYPTVAVPYQTPTLRIQYQGNVLPQVVTVSARDQDSICKASLFGTVDFGVYHVGLQVGESTKVALCNTPLLGKFPTSMYAQYVMDGCSSQTYSIPVSATVTSLAFTLTSCLHAKRGVYLFDLNDVNPEDTNLGDVFVQATKKAAALTSLFVARVPWEAAVKQNGQFTLIDASDVFYSIPPNASSFSTSYYLNDILDPRFTYSYAVSTGTFVTNTNIISNTDGFQGPGVFISNLDSTQAVWQTQTPIDQLTVAGDFSAIGVDRTLTIPFNASQIATGACYFNFAFAFGTNVLSANLPVLTFATVERADVSKTTPYGTFGNATMATGSAPTATISATTAKAAIQYVLKRPLSRNFYSDPIVDALAQTIWSMPRTSTTDPVYAAFIVGTANVNVADATAAAATTTSEAVLVLNPTMRGTGGTPVQGVALPNNASALSTTTQTFKTNGNGYYIIWIKAVPSTPRTTDSQIVFSPVPDTDLLEGQFARLRDPVVCIPRLLPLTTPLATVDLLSATANNTLVFDVVALDTNPKNCGEDILEYVGAYISKTFQEGELLDDNKIYIVRSLDKGRLLMPVNLCQEPSAYEVSTNATTIRGPAPAGSVPLTIAFDSALPASADNFGVALTYEQVYSQYPVVKTRSIITPTDDLVVRMRSDAIIGLPYSANGTCITFDPNSSFVGAQALIDAYSTPVLSRVLTCLNGTSLAAGKYQNISVLGEQFCHVCGCDSGCAKGCDTTVSCGVSIDGIQSLWSTDSLISANYFYSSTANQLLQKYLGPVSIQLTLTNNPILSTDSIGTALYNILGNYNFTCPESTAINFGRSLQLSDWKYSDEPTMFVDTTRVGSLVIQVQRSAVCATCPKAASGCTICQTGSFNQFVVDVALNYPDITKISGSQMSIL